MDPPVGVIAQVRAANTEQYRPAEQTQESKMNYKQAQAVLSDFLMKCEDEGIALPDDPLNAVIAAMRALDHQAKHEVGRPQMEAAIAHMRQECGVIKQAPNEPSSSPSDDDKPTTTSKPPRGATKPRANRVKVEHGGTSSTSGDDEEDEQKTQRQAKDKDKRPTKDHSQPRRHSGRQGKLQTEIRATPATCEENQPLVDQFVELGEFEMHSGHTQRGIARLRAAKALHDADEVICSGAQARKLDRVGQSAATKIDAILHGGLENAMREYTSD